LQDAPTFVPKPDSSGSPDLSTFFLFFYGVLACFTGSIGAIANGGTERPQEPQAIHFLIRISFISVGETPTDRINAFL